MEYDIAPEASPILKTWSQEVKPAGLGHKAHNEVTIVLRGIINFNGATCYNMVYNISRSVNSYKNQPEL